MQDEESFPPLAYELARIGVRIDGHKPQVGDWASYPSGLVLLDTEEELIAAALGDLPVYPTAEHALELIPRSRRYEVDLHDPGSVARYRRRRIPMWEDFLLGPNSLVGLQDLPLRSWRRGQAIRLPVVSDLPACVIVLTKSIDASEPIWSLVASIEFRLGSFTSGQGDG